MFILSSDWQISKRDRFDTFEQAMAKVEEYFKSGGGTYVVSEVKAIKKGSQPSTIVEDMTEEEFKKDCDCD